MVRHSPAELVATCSSQLGESPIWDSREHVLRFLDIERQLMCTWRPDTSQLLELGLDLTVTAIAPTEEDFYIAAISDGFGRVDPDNGHVKILAAVLGGSGSRMNDGAVDPLGRFWAGSSSIDRSRRDGQLWMLDTELNAHMMLDNLGMSNGLGWTASGDIMYHVDTLAGTVTSYDVAEGGDRPELVNPRTIVHLGEEEGLPDGLAVDETDAFWLVVWGAGEVRRYQADGTLDAVVTVDATQPTSCCFHNEDRTTLYITSAREGLANPRDVEGALYAVRVAVPGMFVRPFVGVRSLGHLR